MKLQAKSKSYCSSQEPTHAVLQGRRDWSPKYLLLFEKPWPEFEKYWPI